MNAVVLVRRHSVLTALAAAVTVAVSASCASPSGGESESSCEYRVEYDRRVYSDLANADFKIGEELGPATVPPCDDTPGDGNSPVSPDLTIAYAVEGVDPSIAIAVDDAPDGVLFIAKALENDLPPEVKRLVGGS
ncbi:DUF6281 family protein [Streptomyces sp. NPDC059477]|uniref:DUF6281 family protein n=1 Tax=Streptomyces sp. NPDC059477 TaxID=3346847 RepID=UPI0036B5620B